MIPKIFSYFDQALEMGASDLNIKPGASPVFRVNGHIIYSEDEPLAPQEMFDLLLPLIDAEKQATINTEVDGADVKAIEKTTQITPPTGGNQGA